MSNAINNLFATESNTNLNTGRGLSGTAQLTSIASNLATEIINVMNDDIEAFVDDIKKSQTDNKSMDELIERVHPLTEVDVEFLKELDEATIDGMLKSQQSKRSRCKSKAMTMDNYRALMTGAIAENLIRMASGKEKSAAGRHRMAGSVEYTIEQLQQLSEDQERLKREIRNIQSKKSIMRSKADFHEDDVRYQQLLKSEQQLKDMRVSGVPEVVEVDHTKDALSELLANVDMNALHAKDSKELLAEIAKLAGLNQ